MQIYQGDQYPEEYKGTILMGNIHDSAVHQDKLTPVGATFKASFVRDFVRANDGWFRPVSTQVGRTARFGSWIGMTNIRATKMRMLIRKEWIARTDESGELFIPAKKRESRSGRVRRRT